MAEGYLKTPGYWEATETTEQCYSEQILQQRSDLHWKPGGKGTRNSRGEPSHRTAGPADLFNLTKSRSRVVEPKQSGAETG